MAESHLRKVNNEGRDFFEDHRLTDESILNSFCYYNNNEFGYDRTCDDTSSEEDGSLRSYIFNRAGMNTDLYNYLAGKINSVVKIKPMDFSDYYHALTYYKWGNTIVPKDLYTFQSYDGLAKYGHYLYTPAEAATKEEAIDKLISNFKNPELSDNSYISNYPHEQPTLLTKDDVVAVVPYKYIGHPIYKEIIVPEADREYFKVSFAARPDKFDRYHRHSRDFINGTINVNDCGGGNMWDYAIETNSAGERPDCYGQDYGDWTLTAKRLGIDILEDLPAPESTINSSHTDFAKAMEDQQATFHKKYEAVITKGDKPVSNDTNLGFVSGLGIFYSSFPFLLAPGRYDEDSPRGSDYGRLRSPENTTYRRGTPHTNQQIFPIKTTSFTMTEDFMDGPTPESYFEENPDVNPSAPSYPQKPFRNAENCPAYHAPGQSHLSQCHCYPGSLADKYAIAAWGVSCATNQTQMADQPGYLAGVKSWGQIDGKFTHTSNGLGTSNLSTHGWLSRRGIRGFNYNGVNLDLEPIRESPTLPVRYVSDFHEIKDYIEDGWKDALLKHPQVGINVGGRAGYLHESENLYSDSVLKRKHVVVPSENEQDHYSFQGGGGESSNWETNIFRDTIHWKDINLPPYRKFPDFWGTERTDDDLINFIGGIYDYKINQTTYVTTGFYWLKIEDVRDKAKELGFHFAFQRMSAPYNLAKIDFEYLTTDEFISDDGGGENVCRRKSMQKIGSYGGLEEEAWGYVYPGTKAGWHRKKIPFESSEQLIFWPDPISENDKNWDFNVDSVFNCNLCDNSESCEENCVRMPMTRMQIRKGEEVRNVLWPDFRKYSLAYGVTNNSQDWMLMSVTPHVSWKPIDIDKLKEKKADGSDGWQDPTLWDMRNYCGTSAVSMGAYGDANYGVCDCGFNNPWVDDADENAACPNKECKECPEYPNLEGTDFDLIKEWGERPADNWSKTLELTGYYPFLHETYHFVYSLPTGSANYDTEFPANPAGDTDWIKPVPITFALNMSTDYAENDGVDNLDLYKTDFVKQQGKSLNWGVKAHQNWSGNFMFLANEYYPWNLDISPPEWKERASYPYKSGMGFGTMMSDLTWHSMYTQYWARPLIKITYNNTTPISEERLSRYKNQVVNNNLKLYPNRYLWQDYTDYSKLNTGVGAKGAVFKFTETDLGYLHEPIKDVQNDNWPISSIKGHQAGGYDTYTEKLYHEHKKFDMIPNEKARHYYHRLLQAKEGTVYYDIWDDYDKKLTNRSYNNKKINFIQETILPDFDQNYLFREVIYANDGEAEPIQLGEWDETKGIYKQPEVFMEAEDILNVGDSARKCSFNILLNDVIDITSSENLLTGKFQWKLPSKDVGDFRWWPVNSYSNDYKTTAGHGLTSWTVGGLWNPYFEAWDRSWEFDCGDLPQGKCPKHEYVNMADDPYSPCLEDFDPEKRS